MAINITSFIAATLAANLALVSGTALAGVVYDESVAGDLADAVTVSPWSTTGTYLGAFSAGEFEILGRIGSGATGSDSDVFSWTIAPGNRLDAIALDYQILSGASGNGSYFAIQSDTAIGTGLPTVAQNLDNTLMNGSGDLLAALAGPPYVAGSGFVPPLAAGDYTLFASEIGGEVAYRMTFQVSAVPLPASYLLFTAGLGWLGLIKRRRPAVSAKSFVTIQYAPSPSAPAKNKAEGWDEGINHAFLSFFDSPHPALSSRRGIFALRAE